MSDPVDYIEKFSNKAADHFLDLNPVLQHCYSFTKFNPSTIDVNDMDNNTPNPGSFVVNFCDLPNVPIFASGRYRVTNCIIDDDNEITEKTFDWNVKGVANECVNLVTFDVNDDTACDYYYYYGPTIYKPVHIFPNENIDQESKAIVNYPTALEAIKYFKSVQNSVSNFVPGLFFVVINPRDGNQNNICVLTSHIVSGVQILPGMSLLTQVALIKSITDLDETPTQTQIFVLAYLEYASRLAISLLEIVNNDEVVTLGPYGKSATTMASGTELNLGLWQAGRNNTNLANPLGFIELVFVMTNPNAELFSTALIP